MASSSPSHRWRFFRAGGFDQVKLETGSDLTNLDQLDQKLWVALACPISGLEFDPKTAALIDTDKDGRIRAPELLAALKWAGAMLKDPDLLVKRGDSVPLAAINDSTPEGAALLTAARNILAHHGKPDAASISLSDACDAGQKFAGTLFNGDGVIIPECASDVAIKAVMEEIANCEGAVLDRSGKPGIDQVKVDAFFADCSAFDASWLAAEKDSSNILLLGEKTIDAAVAVKAAKAKVDDYFGRCRLIAFDPRAVALVNRKEEDYAVIVSHDISFNASEVAGFPLAQAAAGKPLPLEGAVNPAHAAMLATLREAAIKPLLGDATELSESAWAMLQARLAPCMTWQEGQAGSPVAKLGSPRVRQLLSGSPRKDIETLIARDKSFEHQGEGIAEVEKLIRFVRDLHLLCVNFVNFKNLYEGKEPAIFQSGVLFLDQRSCHLCLPVEDAARHATMAGLAGAFLAYADCVRKGTGEKMSIVAIFSQGGDQNLMVGRNGIFYDRKGRDYDATITKILPNSISLREAFWSPYRKVVRLIEEQVSKRAAVADAAVNAQLAAVVDTGAATKPKFDPSVIALISVAAGSLAVAFTTFLAYLEKIPFWKLPLFAAGIMLLISGPSVLLTFAKLRRRNLGPILDANGWAINAAARINVPFGTKLTDIAKLPPGSTVDLHDSYAQKAAAWPKIALVVLVVVWTFSFIWDVGILYTITRNWDSGPWGNPPGSMTEKKTKEPPPAVATNAPSANK